MSLRLLSAKPLFTVEDFLRFVDWVAEPLKLNVPPIVNLEKLRKFPPGSLGRELADSLDRHHFKPLTTGPRRKQLHDVVHVVTGYEIDPIGEAEVQAFLLGAKFNFIHIVLGLGLLRMIYQQTRTLSPTWQRLQRAYFRGQQSCLDIDSWQPEQQWELPLSEVLALLHIQST